jgi:hypothetical protein
MVARATQQHTIREHCDAMADSVPLADQYAARRDLSGGRLACFGTLASKPMNQASVRSDSLAERSEFELPVPFLNSKTTALF